MDFESDDQGGASHSTTCMWSEKSRFIVSIVIMLISIIGMFVSFNSASNSLRKLHDQPAKLQIKLIREFEKKYEKMKIDYYKRKMESMKRGSSDNRGKKSPKKLKDSEGNFGDGDDDEMTDEVTQTRSALILTIIFSPFSFILFVFAFLLAFKLYSYFMKNKRDSYFFSSIQKAFIEYHVNKY